MNNKQRDDCALQRRTHRTAQHPLQRRCPALLCLGQVGLLGAIESRLGSTLRLLAFLAVKQVDSVTFPEEEGLQQRPDRLAAPMLAKNASRVQGSINPMKGDKLASNGLSHSMERQCVVAFVELGMRSGEKTVLPRCAKIVEHTHVTLGVTPHAGQEHLAFF
jgi:hypothetical protein